MRETLLAEAARFYWYHCVELAPGVITDGDYDMSEVWPLYRFPDVSGKEVLDVGRASGYFSFAFEDRGARVVATDIASLAEWDWVGGPDARREGLAAHGPAGDEHISGAFWFAKRVRGSQVEAKTVNAYDLDPAVFDGRRFDLVFAGSLVSHVRDPILAFERLRSVTRGTCVVAAPSFTIPAVAARPMMSLIGTAGQDRRSWWVMNASGLVETLRCGGFTDVEVVSEFTLHHRHVDLQVPHLVAHAKP